MFLNLDVLRVEIEDGLIVLTLLHQRVYSLSNGRYDLVNAYIGTSYHCSTPHVCAFFAATIVDGTCRSVS